MLIEFRKGLTFFLMLAGWILSLSSCMKDDQNDPRALEYYSGSVPVVSTRTITGITQTTAQSGGRIISDGGSPVTSYGVCWSTLQYPTIEDNSTNDGSGTANFISIVSNLQVGTTYYLRAFAKNKNGIGYGGQQIFTTGASLKIGDEYAGGIIFYLDPTGVHGLVCSDTDHTVSAIWGVPVIWCRVQMVLLLEPEILTRKRLSNFCHTPDIAAKVCSLLVMNGYNDWFLPSKDELRLIYNNLKVTQLGNSSNSAYWSSTEMNDVFAWQIAFNSGIVQGASKSTPSAVRAVRAF